jgi:hypothetical protein
VLSVALAAASWRWIEAPVLRNGLRATFRGYGAVIAESAAAARRTPKRALPALIPLIAVAVTCTAGYGVFGSASGQTLQQQLAAGTSSSAASRAWVAADRRHPRDAGPAASAGRARGPEQAIPAPAGVLAGVPLRDLGGNVTAIGDSVMVASAAQLRTALPGIYIDALVSRQMSAGIALVRRLAGRHELRPIVVVGLGTNGPVSASQVSALLALAGPQRSVVLISTLVPRPWQNEVNRVVAAAARDHGNAVLANWFATIRNRTGLLWGDGVHPRPPGAIVYARMVQAAVAEAVRRMLT